MPRPPVAPIVPAGNGPILCPHADCFDALGRRTALYHSSTWLHHIKTVHLKNPNGENKKLDDENKEKPRQEGQPPASEVVGQDSIVKDNGPQDGKQGGKTAGGASGGRRKLQCAFKSQGCKAKDMVWSDLRSHLLRHADLAPYRCQLCDYSTPDPSNLRTHNRAHHSTSGTQSRPRDTSTFTAPSGPSSTSVPTPALSDAPTFPDSPVPVTPATLTDWDNADWDNAPLPSPAQALDAACEALQHDSAKDSFSLPYTPISVPSAHVPSAPSWRDVHDAWAVGQVSQEVIEFTRGTRLEGFSSQSMRAVAAHEHAAPSIAQTHRSAAAAPTRLPARDPPARRMRFTQNERFTPYEVPIARSVRMRSRQEPLSSPMALPRLATGLGATLVPRDGGRQVHADEPYHDLDLGSTSASASYAGFVAAGDAEYSAYNDTFCAPTGQAPAPTHHLSPGPAPVALSVSSPTLVPFTAPIEPSNARGLNDNGGHMYSPEVRIDSVTPSEYSYGAYDDLWSATMLQLGGQEDLHAQHLQQAPGPQLQLYDDTDFVSDFLDIFH